MSNRLSIEFKVLHFLVTYFYLGTASKAPGTFGTIGAVLTWALMNAIFGKDYSIQLKCGVITALTVLAWFIIAQYEKLTQTHDDGSIVIDEVVGYLIAAIWVKFTWQAAVILFVLFRFFDIVKPWPISVIDQKTPGALGTLLDDLVAGLFSLLAYGILKQVVAVYL